MFLVLTFFAAALVPGALLDSRARSELRSETVIRPNPRRWLHAWALGTAGFCGCGPVEYLSQVSRRAPAALAQAQQHGAEQLAPYEFTAAQEYLAEARFQGTRASYQRAIEYGRRAEELAARAEGIAREKALRTGSAQPRP
jgi:hypothetical protein